MKNIGYLIVIFLMSSSMLLAQKDAITKLFSENTEDEAFSSVYISPKMFEMIAKISSDDSEGANEIADISKDIETLRILSTNTNTTSFYKNANIKLNGDGFEELMTLKEKGQDIRFVTKSEGGVINELVLLVGSVDSFVMMNFTGKIDLDKLSKLAGKLDIQGADQLNKLNKK